MPRRRFLEDPDHPDRWMVSYADFVTLMFAFFVVMYAISSTNEGKYKQLTTSMISAFRQGGVSVVAVGQTGSANTQIAVEIPLPIAKKTAAQLKLEQEQAIRLNKLASQLKVLLDPLMKKGHVRVSHNELGVAIEVDDNALFESGQARPSAHAAEWLGELAKTLTPQPNRVRVEGYTDDRPIKNAIYPSNWELSAARAGSVVRLFVENGIAPNRLIAIGYAENRPVAPNTTPEGRARNRRVTISVLPESADQAALVPTTP